MPLTLLIRTSDSPTPREITFDAPRIVIGRGASSDLRLPDASVSHRHASIRQRGSDYIVMDEGSTNGTFVGPVKLSAGAPRVIVSGERIRIGRVAIEAKLTAMPPALNTNLATKEIALGLVADALSAQGETAAPLVSVSSGPDSGKSLSLAQFQHPYLVGRLQGVDLVLEEPDASRRHISIQRRGEQVLIQDLGSKNGTLLAGEPLPPNQEVSWSAGSVLSIGTDTLTLTDPVREALLELEQLPDEAVSPADAPVAVDPTIDDAVPAAANAPSPAKRRQVTAANNRSQGWSASDLMVALLALVVLAVSAVSLYWLLGAR